MHMERFPRATFTSDRRRPVTGSSTPFAMHSSNGHADGRVCTCRVKRGFSDAFCALAFRDQEERAKPTHSHH
jgi:hypothetical protein